MLAAGIFGAVAALAAVYERTQTGTGPVDRRLRPGMRRLRARRRHRRMVDPPQRAPPPRRRRARGRHRRLSVPGRLRQRGGGPPRHRQGVRGADRMGRRIRYARCGRAARAAMARLQVPPVARRHRALCAHLRRRSAAPAASSSSIARARRGRSPSRRSTPSRMCCRIRNSPPMAISQRSTTRSCSATSTFPGPPYRLRARRRAARAMRRGSASTWRSGIARASAPAEG